MAEGNKHVIRLTVDGDWDGSRIDRLVRAMRPELSFAAVQTMLRRGNVKLNGGKAAGGTRIETGDIVEIRLAGGRIPSPAAEDAAAPAKKKAAAPEETAASPDTGRIGEEIEVLYEDEDVLVINKPANIVVQPGNRRERGSLMEPLELYRRRKETRTGTEAVFPYTPIHRLDYPTTGALLVAKTRPAARELSEALKQGRIEKIYLAVVDGTPKPAQGTVALPLTVEKGSRSRAKADAAGKRAVTRYYVLKSLPGGRSLLEVRIPTGRTHQIRAHLALIGHPVVGDAVYGERADGAREPLLLHAWKIRFHHRRLERAIEVTAPPPEGFTPLRRAEGDDVPQQN
jgi:RluA family pseudouridine synthase